MGWTDWQVWQYSSKGRIAGIQGNVDLNVAKDDWFNKYIGEVPIEKVVKVISPPEVRIDVTYEG
jgi:hypothetical protein